MLHVSCRLESTLRGPHSPLLRQSLYGGAQPCQSILLAFVHCSLHSLGYLKLFADLGGPGLGGCGMQGLGYGYREWDEWRQGGSRLSGPWLASRSRCQNSSVSIGKSRQALGSLWGTRHNPGQELGFRKPGVRSMGRRNPGPPCWCLTRFSTAPSEPHCTAFSNPQKGSIA